MNLADVKFSFKATVVKDANDEPVKDENGKVKKLPADPPITIKVPQFENAADALEIFTKNDEKEVKLALDALNEMLLSNAKAQIDEDRVAAREKGIDPEKLSWTFIANLPPATRKGTAIPDEVWDAFAKDYIETIVHHGKTQAQAEMGAKFLVRKMYPVKDNKRVVEGLQKNLQIWYANTPSAEDFQAVYENLMSRANTLLAADIDVLAAAV